MIVFRLSKAVFSNDLSGKGAEKSGGRWNSKGTAIIYTSQSRALCTTEVAVHIPLGIIPKDYEMVSIEISEEVQIAEIAIKDLPEDWKNLPPQKSTQILGDNFVKEGKFLVLKVPSVVVQGDYNYLINPAHKDFQKHIKIIKTEPFKFDERMFRK